MRLSNKSIIYASVSTAVFLWGVSFIWSNSILNQNFPVFSLMFFRMSFAAIMLTVVSFSLKKVQRVKRKDWGWFLLLVFLEPFLYFIGETVGLKSLGSPTISSVIVSTIPIFALIAGIIFYKERISLLNTFGISMTLPGIVLIVLEKGSIDISHHIGILFLMMAVFAAVGYSMVVKKLAHKYNSYTIVTYQHILGALYFLPFFLYFDYKEFSFSNLTPSIIMPLLYLSILCSCLAFILFINSIKELGIARANIFTSMVPVVSAYVAYMLGHDTISFRKIIGIVIVVIGVILAQRPKKGAPQL